MSGRAPTMAARHGAMAGQTLRSSRVQSLTASGPKAAAARRSALVVRAIREGEKLDRKLRVAVVGGGPAGACAAESLARAGIETYLIERKLDNCKVSSLLRTPIVPTHLLSLSSARISHVAVLSYLAHRI